MSQREDHLESRIDDSFKQIGKLQSKVAVLEAQQTLYRQEEKINRENLHNLRNSISQLTAHVSSNKEHKMSRKEIIYIGMITTVLMMIFGKEGQSEAIGALIKGILL